MSFKKSIKNLLGMGDDDDLYDEDYNDDYEVRENAPYNQEPDRYKPRVRQDEPVRRNLYPISGGQSPTGAKISIVRPKTFDESKNICDEMKENKILVVNTSEMEPKDAQRLLDFICGAAYNSGGDVQEVEPKVFVLSPPMVEVTRNRQTVTKSTFLNF